jgi:hypothetical protein
MSTADKSSQRYVLPSDELPCHLRVVEGHGEDEAQRRNRTVDARRAHAGLRLMQLKTAKAAELGYPRIGLDRGFFARSEPYRP